MNKKRNIILACLLIVMLLLGIGYAAFSDSVLQITTSASALAHVFNVCFDHTATPTTTVTPIDPDYANNISVDAPVPEEGSKSVTCTFNGLHNIGDEASATYTIINSGSITASRVGFHVGETAITEPPATSATTYTTSDGVFKFTVALAEGQSNSNLAPNGKIKFTVTARLLKQVDEAKTGSCVVSSLAIPVQE